MHFSLSAAYSVSPHRQSISPRVHFDKGSNLVTQAVLDGCQLGSLRALPDHTYDTLWQFRKTGQQLVEFSRVLTRWLRCLGRNEQHKERKECKSKETHGERSWCKILDLVLDARGVSVVKKLKRCQGCLGLVYKNGLWQTTPPGLAYRFMRKERHEEPVQVQIMVLV